MVAAGYHIGPIKPASFVRNWESFLAYPSEFFSKI
ncbi:hypothetical protein ZOD2009_05552 [Haladaptatus paucihalophilus DX253]|uniref:Uncharacterized protein n=1 Tax=Haladaptatus paucihalophilus DX253 TaxID=797209 RepID=E7QQP0_HALPU|nr:hypothetical protein ZOD2009_05552 [Haladaptatus paucihalophilus DX253]